MLAACMNRECFSMNSARASVERTSYGPRNGATGACDVPSGADEERFVLLGGRFLVVDFFCESASGDISIKRFSYPAGGATYHLGRVLPNATPP